MNSYFRLLALYDFLFSNAMIAYASKLDFVYCIADIPKNIGVAMMCMLESCKTDVIECIVQLFWVYKSGCCYMAHANIMSCSRSTFGMPLSLALVDLERSKNHVLT